MEIRFIPFRSRSDRGWAEVRAIYEASFPACEQRSETAYDAAFGDPRFTADGIWLGDRPVGLLFHWRGDGFRYVEHLAIDATLRGQELGKRALCAFCARDTTPVILEIDPPEEEMSIRRLGFYRRLGFVENPHEYLHPSYCRPFAPHRLVLMSRPGALENDEARLFADFIREHVLRYSDHDEATLPRL